MVKEWRTPEGSVGAWWIEVGWKAGVGWLFDVEGVADAVAQEHEG